MNHGKYGNPWTAERIEFVKARWLAGYSASQIAMDIGGVSRNAVIGKIHRLGMKGRRQPNQRLPKGPKRIGRVTGPRQRSEHFARTFTPPKERRPLLELPKALPKPESLKLSILELTRCTCRWPGSEEEVPFTYCGHIAVEGEPYCAYHEQVAHSGRATQRDFDRIASRSMGDITELGKAVVAE